MKRCFAHDDSHRDSTSCEEQEQEEEGWWSLAPSPSPRVDSTSIPSIVPFAGAVEELCCSSKTGRRPPFFLAPPSEIRRILGMIVIAGVTRGWFLLPCAINDSGDFDWTRENGNYPCLVEFWKWNDFKRVGNFSGMKIPSSRTGSIDG